MNNTLLELKSLKQNLIFFDECICPNCNNKLEKSPSRKIKCPICKKNIYSRRLGLYDHKMLLSDNDIIEAEKYNTLFGYLDVVLCDPLPDYKIRLILDTFYLSEEKYNSIKLLNPNLTDSELLINLSEQSLTFHLEKYCLGLYTSALYSLSQLHCINCEFETSLNYINQVIYLLLNGVENSAFNYNLETNYSLSGIYPANLRKAISTNLLLSKKVTLSDLERNFKNQDINSKIKTSLSLDVAWEILSPEFSTELKNFGF